MPQDDLPPLPAVLAGKYRHHKGNFYELIGAVRHSETLEVLALYRPLDGNGRGEAAMWVRPWAMFFDTVLIDGVAQPRFARLAEPLPDQAAPGNSS